MQFYFDGADGTSRKITEEEAREHLSNYQIAEAVVAKLEDPHEEVSYKTVGGIIRVEIN